MKSTTLGVVGCALCVFILLFVAGAGYANGIHWFSNAAPISCQEDMSCWDCATMGNKRCGIKR